MHSSHESGEYKLEKGKHKQDRDEPGVTFQRFVLHEVNIGDGLYHSSDRNNGKHEVERKFVGIYPGPVNKAALNHDPPRRRGQAREHDNQKESLDQKPVDLLANHKDQEGDQEDKPDAPDPKAMNVLPKLDEFKVLQGKV